MAALVSGMLLRGEAEEEYIKNWPPALPPQTGCPHLC